ncbi:hypothetical protein DM02DRAFT_427761 [Periconia macrospinosa]|uniref:Rhodopsin domain-containing protein n=1 Tax=Periconia macrospinosa TaxID=97972 RepID=A0A2V1EB80_9PLEO|nr:hypothetical protein DM02DRAFT_427761 [Periconia macrospinosa]
MTDKPDASLIPAPLTGYVVELAHQFAGLTIFFIVLATILCGARVWTRCHPVYKMSADDYVCLVAYVPIVIGCALLLQTVPWVFNNKDPAKLTLHDIEQGFKYAIIAQTFWTWAMSLTKISIALMLLRLEQSQPMRRFLWFLVVLQVVMSIFTMLSQLLQCIPLRSAWDFTSSSSINHCWSKATGMSSAIAIQVFNFVTDWILALMPISFLRKVKRPLRERVVVNCLMGLGVFAGIVSLVKLVYLIRAGKTQESALDGIRFGMLSALEELLAFVAACIPCLKVPFQRALRYFGLKTHEQHNRTVVDTSRFPYSGADTSRSWTVNSEEGAYVGTRLSRFGGGNSESEEFILTSVEEGDVDGKLNGIWGRTEVQIQRDVEEQMIIQSHTPALPPPTARRKGS